MDSITQVLLGSAVAATVAPKRYRKRAMLTGALLGTLPDLDVFISYENPVNQITSHRGFSHSLFILPAVALIILPLLMPFYKSLSRLRLYSLVTLALITHPLLDSLTSYGTQLWYPLPVTPTTIASVYIVDPFYSVWLLVGLLLYLCSSSLRWVHTLGLVMSSAYLLLGLGMQQRAMHELLKRHPGTHNEQWYIGVANASPLCWRGVHYTDDRYTEVLFNVLSPDVMATAQYHKLPDHQAPLSPSWQTLKWFNPNTVLRKDGDGSLVSSDLRMGEFGQYLLEFTFQPEPKRRSPFTTTWQPYAFNDTYEAMRARAPSSPIAYKWDQFTHCVKGTF